MADNPSETSASAGQEWQSNVEYLRGLAQIVREAGLSGLEIETDSWKVALRGPRLRASSGYETAPVASPIPASDYEDTSSVSIADAAPLPDQSLVPVVSPMVGVWYRAPSPSEPNFVEIGDRVEVGQTIGLVEAMKVFNEITAESGGVAAQISAQTGQLVETGQPLLMLRR